MSPSIYGDAVERDITKDEVLPIIAEHGGYGSSRVYGVIADGETAGQIAAIKSEYHLERFTYSRIYVISR